MKKELFYYFYIDTYEFYEVYKIHLECLKRYINVFNNVHIILSLKDPYDDSLINTWKEYISSYLSIEHIDYIIVKNNIKFREGEHFYNLIYEHFADFDGLIFWGHGKRDFDYDTDNVYNWICAIHYLSSLHIDLLENILGSNYNEYCVSGPLIEKYNYSINLLMYEGGMYWIYPKKLLKICKQGYDDYKMYLYIISKEPCYEHEILFCGENWMMHFLNKNNMHYFQKSITDNIHIPRNDGYVQTSKDILIHSLASVKDDLGEDLYNDILKYSQDVKNIVMN